MKYGHLNSKVRRHKPLTLSASLNAAFPKAVAMVPSLTTEEFRRDEVRPEFVWASARLHLNLM